MQLNLKGTGVSEGVAMAQLRLFAQTLPDISTAPAEDPEKELAVFARAMDGARAELQALYESAVQKMGEKEAEIFEAHLTMLEDDYSVGEPIRTMIREEKQNAPAAIVRQFDELAAMFRSLDDALLQERAADAEDLKQLLLRCAFGIRRQDLSRLDEDVIVLARELTPSDTVRMDTAHVKGIATRLGGMTAHSAIIARTLGIPAVVGVTGWESLPLDGQTAILDGTRGVLLVEPEAAEIETFQKRRAAAESEAQALAAYRSRPSQTRDGQPLELCANIGAPEEAKTAVALGADGVGLFRSEFLFMDRDDLPTEEEQFAAYRQALEAMQGKPLIVRTLDAGGDKKLPALDFPHEDNPFLGFRAIRLTLSRPAVFLPQLRALLRASVYGDLRVMFPMISAVEELRAAKAMLAEAREALQKEGVPVAGVKVGMMIEIPSAAVLADVFAREVDFFSIGTNDLTQYTLAVERGNEAVAQLYRPEHPAVLRLIAATGKAAAAAGIPCGMCGEAAGDLRLAPAFVGMGVTELSMSPRKITALRKHLSELTLADCRRQAEELLR